MGEAAGRVVFFRKQNVVFVETTTTTRRTRTRTRTTTTRCLVGGNKTMGMTIPVVIMYLWLKHIDVT